MHGWVRFFRFPRLLSWACGLALAWIGITAVRSGQAQEAPWFSGLSLTNGAVQLTLELPVEQRAAWLSDTPSLTAPDWNLALVQRPAPGQTQTVFSVISSAAGDTAFFCSHSATNYSPTALRMRMLYGGYFLTVDPKRALSAATAADRYRLFVLHALLVDPATGRIAAIWPPFEGDYTNATVTAHPVSDYPELLTNEVPAEVSLSPAELAEYWLKHGVSSNLFWGADVINLRGAVVTPGLIDGHFHVSSWAKKVPDEGQRFGYLPDISDPAYYAKTNGVGRRSAHEALTEIVEDANLNLTNTMGVALHGYLYSWVNDDPATGGPLETYLFRPSPASANVLDPEYLINGVVQTNGAPRAALLVQTSGQCCWYNGALLDRYNNAQTNAIAKRFPPAPLTGYTPPEEGQAEWTFDLDIVQGSDTNLYDFASPNDVDLRLPAEPGEAPVLVPFTITRIDEAAQRAWGTAMLPAIADAFALQVVSGAELIPLVRPIPASIDTQTWNEAASLAGEAYVEPSGTSYGHWDPRKPYSSNWYDGAERGLAQYFYDPTGGLWRASGYAEHYVMRDLLSAVVMPPLTVADNVRMRRNVARWCHRHGVTCAHDIMVYRRRSSQDEFYAYEALSYERDPTNDPAFFEDRKLDKSVQTGRFGLRVGQYYYIESMEEVDESLSLAMDPAKGFDRDRLCPPADHPDYPGWVAWLGWKLQLDGAIASRNIFSSAPTSKPYSNEVFETVDELGRSVVFKNHSFGLLTETSEQEQELSSRETAALYWLVRESLPHDWSVFRSGVTEWLGRSVQTNWLRADLKALSHVDMKVTNAFGLVAAEVMADKLSRVVSQVNDAYDRMLKSLAKIWYERSKAAASGNPIPNQVVCHCTGDGAVDLFVKAIQNLRDDLAAFPPAYSNLPAYWQAAIPPTGNLAVVRRAFANERYRVEHAVNITPQTVTTIRSPFTGIETNSQPATRNVVFSSQPCIMALDGEGARASSFPISQELWPLPGASNFWNQLPPVPRYGHIHPGPLYMDYDIPFAIDTDPPSIRDPRPVLTLIGAVARSPIDIDPFNWLDKRAGAEKPDSYPPDYLANFVYPPLGLDTAQHTNRMGLTREQALCAMTFWNAYAGNTEKELGALASPHSATNGPGWLADFVVWQRNPLAIRNADGLTLEDLAMRYDSLSISQQVQIVDTFIQKFRPVLTVVGGMPMYVAPGTDVRWQGVFR